MLDETTCPVCGKELNGTQRLFEDDPVLDGIWAVAHYLAHLVEQKANEPQVPRTWSVMDSRRPARD